MSDEKCPKCGAQTIIRLEEQLSEAEDTGKRLLARCMRLERERDEANHAVSDAVKLLQRWEDMGMEFGACGVSAVRSELKRLKRERDEARKCGASMPSIRTTPRL